MTAPEVEVMPGDVLADLEAGVGPRWSGALLAATGLLFPVSRIGGVEALSIAADVVFLVALLPLWLVPARRP